jgi:hypothetical protein
MPEIPLAKKRLGLHPRVSAGPSVGRKEISLQAGWKINPKCEGQASKLGLKN